MARTDTDHRPETARTLVVIDGEERDGPRSPTVRGRPLAAFVTQLLTSGDPALRPSRLERTRAAAACYTETARRRA